MHRIFGHTIVSIIQAFYSAHNKATPIKCLDLEDDFIGCLTKETPFLFGNLGGGWLIFFNSGPELYRLLACDSFYGSFYALQGLVI